MKDAESVRNQQQQHVQQYSCTLDECFQLYTKEEQVVRNGTAWRADLKPRQIRNNIES